MRGKNKGSIALLASSGSAIRASARLCALPLFFMLLISGAAFSFSCPATGGTITQSGSYCIHTFTTHTGTFVPNMSMNVEVLVVAGGGGGGGNGGGGGGAGGLVYVPSYPVSGFAAYIIKVGDGGAGCASNTVPGSNGSNSTFSTFTAIGGGGGASRDGGGRGQNGGSGGGGANPYTALNPSGYLSGYGTSSQGQAGGNGPSTNMGSDGCGGGGGGAAAAGSVGGIKGGNGGNGQLYGISGTNTYYAGGGGGGSTGYTPPGAGGSGGAGSGGNSTIIATSGNAGTGSGGGGGGGAPTRNGGSGGSGIVIVRYLVNTPPTANVTITPEPTNDAAPWCAFTITDAEQPTLGYMLVLEKSGQQYQSFGFGNVTSGQTINHTWAQWPLSVGDRLQCKLYYSDYIDNGIPYPAVSDMVAVVLGHPYPTVTSFTISPDPIFPYGLVHCQAAISDAQYTSGIIAWSKLYRNGNLVLMSSSSLNNNTNTQLLQWALNATVQPGDELQCSMSYDMNSSHPNNWNGIDAFSNTVKVTAVPYLPAEVKSFTIYPASPLLGDTVYCNVTLVDAYVNLMGGNAMLLKNGSIIATSGQIPILNNTNTQVMNWTVAGASPGDELQCKLSYYNLNSGWAAESNKIVVGSANTLPIATSFVISPESPAIGDKVYCHATIVDAEQAAGMEASTKLLKNGNVLPPISVITPNIYNNTNTQVFNWTLVASPAAPGVQPGDSLRCVMAFDLANNNENPTHAFSNEVFVAGGLPANTLPSVTSFVMSPESPAIGDMVYCHATIVDAEQAAGMAAIAVLYRNGTPVSGLVLNTAIYNNTSTQVLNWTIEESPAFPAFSPGDVLQCSLDYDVNSSHPDNMGARAYSNEVKIWQPAPDAVVNEPPEATAFIISPEAALPGTVSFMCNALVADDHSPVMDYTASLYNRGTVVLTTSGQINNNMPTTVLSHTVSAVSGDEFFCLLQYNDGEKDGTPKQTQTVYVQAASAPPFTCDQSKFNDTMMLCGIAALSMVALVSLVYIFGETAQSPRMLTWAKTEAVQVVASLVIVSILLFVLSTMCSFQVGELKEFSGVSSMPKIYLAGAGADSLYNGAMRYVENLAALSLSNIASLRYDLGAYEVRTSYNTFDCSGDCLFSLSSVSISPFSGNSLNLAITNNLMGLATVSYLSVIFQYFTLIYIYSGLFVLFLPMAIVIRSVPFMRHFGGALIAIFVSLYIIYPLMLVADAYIAPGLTLNALSGNNGGAVVMCARDNRNCKGSDVFSTSATTGITCSPAGSPPCYGHNEWQIEGVGRSEDAMNGLRPNDPARAIRLNVLIFLAAIFLPAINFIVIAAFGRELSRFLGEEADLSRLGQMI